MKYIITCVILSILIGCSKNRLTPATQVGANTFSCKIDGEVFKPESRGGIFDAPPITVYNFSIAGFVLSARFNKTNNGNIPKAVEINLFHLKEKGVYDLGINPYAIYRLTYAGGPTYYTNNVYTGRVTITRCDTINKIYSGTFFFKAIDENTGKVVNVTDGRFDVKE